MCDGSVSADAQLNDGTCLGGFISGREIPFPGKQRLWLQRAVRLSRLMRVEAEQLVLPRPFGRQIAKADEAHAVRQPALDRGLDEIGGKEGKRDRHIDLAYAAPLSICDAFGRCRCVGDEFVKPTPSACNRCDQRRSGLGAYGAYVLSRGRFREEYLTTPRRQDCTKSATALVLP